MNNIYIITIHHGNHHKTHEVRRLPCLPRPEPQRAPGALGDQAVPTPVPDMVTARKGTGGTMVTPVVTHVTTEKKEGASQKSRKHHHRSSVKMLQDWCPSVMPEPSKESKVWRNYQPFMDIPSVAPPVRIATINHTIHFSGEPLIAGINTIAITIIAFEIGISW